MTFLVVFFLAGLMAMLMRIELSQTRQQLLSNDNYNAVMGLHGIMMVEGKIGSPPYPPSETFPWGTDNVGRDLQALVLSGTRQTMTLAFFGMLARLGLGVFLDFCN